MDTSDAPFSPLLVMLNASAALRPEPGSKVHEISAVQGSSQLAGLNQTTQLAIRGFDGDGDASTVTDSLTAPT